MADSLPACPTIVALDQATLSTSTSMANTVFSDPIPIDGNRVVLALVLRAWSTSGTPSMAVTLDGSRDGKVWKDTGIILSISSGSVLPLLTTTALSVATFPYVRVKAVLSGTSVNAIFDALVTVNTF